MSNLTALREHCRAILARHRGNCNVDMACVVCQQRVRGEESSMEHYANVHGVRIKHFDNVADLNGFLAHLRELLFPSGDEKIHCPVCHTDCGDKATWMSHLRHEGHGQWDVGTIPSLAAFCVASLYSDGSEGEDDNDDEEEEQENNTGSLYKNSNNNNNNFVSVEKEENEEDEDEDGDWDVEPALCLLCDTASLDCVRHMMEVHAFDFPAAVRNHDGVRDEYDIIRIVNVIRKCVAQNICPFHYSDESDSADVCRHDISTSSLIAHLQSNPQHILPRVVPEGDKELIPVICGDAFISSVVLGDDLLAACNNGINNNDEPDYPMIPTISEIVKMRAARAERNTTITPNGEQSSK
ncbi:ZN622/Rei1/Reh1 [Trypanosoma melophagium]|uniref:ZN622/Rei1/Reh1 n=1 Tax=Trypanosoma melophagium TaxID=715481 RepID=UPI003519FAF5|nr:ZN622/Rei1/Reh1 [Trypanosoma melophagium]